MCLATCLIVALQASAYDFVVDGIYYNISGSNAVVTYKDANYNSYSGTVNIPARVTNGGTTYSVVSIGPSAFQGCTNLKRVVIPNTVEYLMNNAFDGCTGLSNITIPASVYTIYNNVFAGCTSLKSVICLSTTPRNWNKNNFSTQTYSGAKLIVPVGCAQAYQSSSYCWGQFDSVLEMDCDFCEDAIFYDIINDNEVSVTHACRFEDCYSGVLEVPSTVTHNGTTYAVTEVGKEAFYYDTNLTSVTLPSTINYIDMYAFYGCQYLTQVNIPEGVADINYCAFAECTRLPNIIIPSSVSWIAQNAFSGCMSLANITCHATTPPMCVDSSSFPASAYNNATLNVPSSSLEQYQTASVWSNFSSIAATYYDFESNGIYYIITGPNTASVTFRDNSYNSYSGYVTIPTTVTHNGATYTVTAVGRSAFRQCSSLTGVSIPNTVTVIDNAAFYQCTSLTSLTIPNSVLTIGDQALRESGLTQITIGDNVTSIGRSCFYKCENLTSVTIPNSVTELGQLCFQYCGALESASLGTGLTRIPVQCFTFCEALSSVNIPSGVKVIDNFAFYDSGLISVTLPEGVDTVAYSSFSSCYNLVSISFPASVKFIGEYALGDCPSLYIITVDSSNPYYTACDNELYDKEKTRLLRYPPAKPFTYAETLSSCVTIDRLAFEGASNLLHIGIGPNVANIGPSAFLGCTSLRQFHVDGQNTHFIADDGVLYTQVNGSAQTLMSYPLAKPDKHYSVLNSTDSILDSAFDGATLLQSVYVPKNLKYLGSNAFAQSSLKRVVIDEGLTTIPAYAFYFCEQLESLHLPSTVTALEIQALAGTVALGEITFAGSTPPALASNVFYGVGYFLDDPVNIYVNPGAAAAYSAVNWNSQSFNTPTITEVSPLGSEVTFTVDSINYTTSDANLHIMVSGVTSTDIYDPGLAPKISYQGNLCTLTEIDYYSLANCTRMTKVDVPFTVSLIDGYAFYGATALKNVRLREGLEQISQFSFSHIDAMTNITIPASVDSVATTSFNYSIGLKRITVDAANSTYTDVDGVLFSKDKKLLVAYPNGHDAAYTVPVGTETICSSAFRGASSLKSVTMPTTLRTIEGSAFYDNASLLRVTVPEGVTSIGVSAFAYCSALSRVELPSTLVSLDYLAFNNATSLSTLAVKAIVPPTCHTRINPRTGEMNRPFMDEHFSSVSLVVPTGSKADYQAANVWKLFENISEADYYRRGDVNDDGLVDITDVTLLINSVLTGNTSGINILAADCNGDENLDITDVTLLINCVLTGGWPESKGIDMWYLWGNFFGSDIWGTQTGNDAIGVSVLPMYPVGTFNSEGKGTLTWTGYIPRQYFTIVHKPGSDDEMWVIENATGNYSVRDMSDNDPDYSTFILNPGYYTITLNTTNMSLSFEPYAGDESAINSFGSITIPGYYNGWSNTSTVMEAVNTRLGLNNHDWWLGSWSIDNDNSYYGEIKFCAYDDWDYNWGGTDFPYGTGIPGGNNINAQAGYYYNVFFNDITGQYNFIPIQ